MSARGKDYRHDLVSEMGLLEGIYELSFHPDGVNGIGGKYDNKPVATLKGGANLIMPFLSTDDVRATIPGGDAVAPKGLGQAICELPILGRM